MTNVMRQQMFHKHARFSAGATILCQFGSGLNPETHRQHVPCEILAVKKSESGNRSVYMIRPLGEEKIGIALDPVESNEENSYTDDLFCNITATLDKTSAFFKNVQSAKERFRF